MGTSKYYTWNASGDHMQALSSMLVVMYKAIKSRHEMWMFKRCACYSSTKPFAPVCTNSCPFHQLTSNISLYSCLYPSHPLVPIFPPPPTFTYLWPYFIISSLYSLCQYLNLNQPPHYLKFLDQFLAALIVNFTTGLIFVRTKQGVATLCFDQMIKCVVLVST